MKGDFSRDTFDKTKHFSRVLMQQGRVQLDADWNEQTAILLHYIRTLAADLIGPFAGPNGAGLGFEIKTKGNGDSVPADEGFTIGIGRYYVDGILCENFEQVTYDKQSNLPNPPPIKDKNNYLVYLDVWERHVTPLEDDYIREKALGGPSTATRAEIVWQVKHASWPSKWDGAESQFKTMDWWLEKVAEWQPKLRGCLNARVDGAQRSTDPCLTSPEARYRGPENQLYRVEIHAGGKAGGKAGESANGPTFKWSRDNGSIVTAIEAMNGLLLTVQDPRGFSAGCLVELTSDELELKGKSGALVPVVAMEGNVLTLKDVPSKPASLDKNDEWHPTQARRWDGLAGIVESNDQVSGWLPMENGIQIRFQKLDEDGHTYRVGDYWLIPARVATGNIEWPVDDNTAPLPRPPHGVQHHYAPLAALTWSAETTMWEVKDLRLGFPPCNESRLTSQGEDGYWGAPRCGNAEA